MGLKDLLKKDKGQEFPMDFPPPYSPSVKDDDDMEEGYGHSTSVQTGDGDGNANANDENYKTLGRWRACVLLITIEVGIGILSLPAALKTLGLIPGIIAILGFGALATSWSSSTDGIL
jgi:hypothetical protein